MIYFLTSNLTGYLYWFLSLGFALNICNVECTIKRVLITTLVIQLIVAVVTAISDFDFAMLVVIYSSVLVAVVALRIFVVRSWRQSIFIVMIFNLTNVIIEYLLLLGVILQSEATQGFLLDNLYIARIVSIILMVGLYVFSKIFRYREYLPLEHFATAPWILYLSIFALFADYNIVGWLENLEAQSLPDVIIVILFLVFFSLNLVHLKNIREKMIIEYQLEYAEQELMAQQLYADSQKRITDDLRGFRHNYANNINSINGFVQKKNYEGLEEYMREIIVNVITSQTLEIADVAKDIPILYGILLEKISRAELNGIVLNVSIIGRDINLKYCSALDYSSMIDILLNNALEAAEKSDDKLVDFGIHSNSYELTTMVANSCSGVVDTKRIFERGYSTKDEPSGEGLYQIHRFQEKYRKMGHNMEIKTTFNMGFLTQMIKI